MTPPESRAPLDEMPRWLPFVVMGALTLLVFRNYLISGTGDMLLGQDAIVESVSLRRGPHHRGGKWRLSLSRLDPAFPAADAQRSRVEAHSPRVPRRGVHVPGGSSVRHHSVRFPVRRLGL